MNIDHINEHYHGDRADPQTERARQRIHWICSQAIGQEILDVGCSQGIVCQILGREGFRCTGVDIEAGSLAIAQKALAQEDEIVQRRVTFQVADASQLPFKDESFDTVVLGEILEHLTHPAKVLAEAKRVLRDGGRLVVTVPHGLNISHDHKRSFYPISLLGLLQPFFKTHSVDTLSHYIIYTGLKERGYGPDGLSKEALFDDYLRLEKMVEAHCLEKEQALLETGTKLRAQIKTLTAQATTQTERIKEMEETAAAREKHVLELETALEESRHAATALREAARKAEDDLARVRIEAASSVAALAAMNSELGLIRVENGGLRKELLTKEEAVLRLQAEAADTARALASAGRQISALEKDSEVALASARLQIETLEAETARLRQDLAAQEASLARARTEAASSGTALAAARDQNQILQAENTGLRQDLATRKAGWQEHLTEVENRHAARLREREKQLRDLTAQREADWARRATNQRMREVVHAVLPAGAQVLVISKGDDDLLQLDGRHGWHFPQTAGGVYAGHHPGDSAEAIAHLESLRAKGAQFLLIPATAFWWLEFYADFRRHLESRHPLLAYHVDTCFIFSLGPVASDRKLRPVLSLQGTPDPQPASVPPARPPAQQAAPAPVTVAAPPTAPPTAAGARQRGTIQAASGSPAPGKKPLPTSLVVGAILDEFTTACFAPECSLVTFRPDNWKAVIERNPIDMLFVESAWRGNDGAWQFKIVSVPKGDELGDLVNYCRSKRIPTVFWNKEDPAHFDRFIKSASLFDCVFTTDSDCVARYQEHLQHERNFALPFAAQSRIHHPILVTERLHNACFAGAYYGLSHDERRKDMDVILKPALEYGLHIFDRQHGMVGPAAEQYRFPDIYQPAIKGHLSYDQMVKAYKRYRVFLNVNSVKTSPTMFSRRVFELLACGTPVISAYARGIENLLGAEVVAFADSEAETRKHLDRLLTHESEWARASTRGIRAVFDRHTYTHRWHALCQTVDSAYEPPRAKTVTAIAVLGKGTNLRRLTEVLTQQTYRHFAVRLYLEKGLAAMAAEPLANALPGIAVQVFPGVKDVASACASIDSGDYLWLIQPTDFYGADFLKDLMLAATYSDAEFVGKHTHFVLSKNGAGPELTSQGYEYRQVSSLPPGSLIAKRGSLTEQAWNGLLRQQTFQATQRRVLSIDRFNYVRGAYAGTGSRAEQSAGTLKEAIV
jgi:spore maturation protein CgeB/SAM-dependent methyltransferase